jgi:hypothetical protein
LRGLPESAQHRQCLARSCTAALESNLCWNHSFYLKSELLPLLSFRFPIIVASFLVFHCFVLFYFYPVR